MKIFDIILYISGPLALLSFGGMSDYLYKKKLVKHRFGGDPITVSIKYISTTINETGHIGNWFWIMVVAVISTLILGFTEDFWR